LVASPGVLDFGTLPRGVRRSATLKVGITQGRTIRGRVLSNQSWISVDTPDTISRLHEATIKVTVDTSQLRDGVFHFGSVYIESLAYGALTVPVTLYVPEEPKPCLRVEPEAFQFEAAPDSAEPTLRTIRIWDDAACPMSGSVHVKPGWLKANVVDFENVTELTVDLTADVKGLKPGQCYSGRIEIHSTVGRATVSVRVTVTPRAKLALDYDNDGEWADQLAEIDPTTEWEKSFLQTLMIQARQKGWKPTTAQRTVIDHLWRRHLEKDC
jgi:hypothetical protein